MAEYRFLILGAGWLLWIAPFFRVRKTETAATVDRRARWGILIQGLAYAVVWFGPFWFHVPEDWEVALAVLFFVVADAMAWASTRALGRQWRIEAGLNPDHELVRSGPYRVVRHPIYASMMGMLLGTGFLITPLVRLAIALAIFVVGTEVRVRVEDALLESHFGEAFRSYRQGVAAYIPLVR